MHWVDPDHLPETSGLVDCFLVNGEGEADGLVLTDGTEVHFPPHLSQAVLAVVRPGAIVRVRGVRPRGVAMIAAVSIAPEWLGKLGVPIGGKSMKDVRDQALRLSRCTARSEMEAQGIVRQALHGPKGEVRGLLLENGRAGRFPPHVAASVAGLVTPGQPTVLRGAGLAARTAPSSRSGRSAPRLTTCARSRPISRGRRSTTKNTSIDRTVPSLANRRPAIPSKP